MNKFYDIQQAGILGELNHLEKLQNAKKRIDHHLHHEYHLSTNSTMKNEIFNRNTFSAHPRFESDESDSSILLNSPCDSPRRFFISSKKFEDPVVTENENENIDEIVAESRHKLHENLTCTREREMFDLEMALGDSLAVAPFNGRREKSRTAIHQKKSIFTMSDQPLKSVTQKCLMSETVFEKKFKMFVEKTLHTLNDIGSILDRGIDPPDGDEDVSRRQLRVKEFSNRFSRNYLYPIVRQLDDLNKWKPSNQNTNQKILSSYQVILNGLQAYQNHLPTSIGGCSSDKLKQLLEHLLDLCDIHTKMTKRESDLYGYTDFLRTIRMHVELTLQKIEDHFTAISTESMLKSTTTKLSLQNCRTDPKNNKSKLKKSNIEDRLSMYSATASFRKDALWKKTAEALAKKKLNVKSRYKTSTYKHRPPLDKPGAQDVPLPSKCRLFARKSSTILRKTPVASPVNEDNIPTMVQMEGTNDIEGKADENKVESVNHEEIVERLLCLVLDSDRKGESRSGDKGKKISDFLEELRTKGDIETLQKVLETLQERRQSQEKLELKVLESSEMIGGDIPKKRKEPTVTVTGARNAKLICIKDDNSDLEADDGGDSEDGKDRRTEKCCPLKSVSSSQTQTECRPTESKTDRSTRRPATAVSMKRLKKTSKYLQMLPKEFAVSIVQYKIDFHKHCKGNPMYRRTTNILPWELMARISDEILDFALIGVAKEIEVNDVVNNIYQSELQL